MNKVFLYGAGGHAKVVAEIARLRGLEILGFIDDQNSYRDGEVFCDAPVIAEPENIRKAIADTTTLLVPAVGDCACRKRIIDIAQRSGKELLSVIHPSAVVSPQAVIGRGTVIAAGAVINPAVTVGNAVIINTSASVDHDCFISDAAHICPGVRLGGCVEIGPVSWIGIGSTIIEKVKIGGCVKIGAGSLVLSDVPANTLAYGTPAKVMRSYD